MFQQLTLIQMAMVAVGLAALGIITVEGVLISRRRGGEPYDWAAFWTTVRINLWRVVVESLPMGAVLGVVTLGVLVNGMNLLGVHTYYQIGVRAVILIAVVAVDALSAANLRKKLVMQSYGNRE